MPPEISPEAKRIMQNLEVQKALKGTGKNKAKGFRWRFKTSDKIAVVTYLLVLIGLTVLQWLLKLEIFKFVNELQKVSPYVPHIKDIVEGAMSMVLILLFARVVKGIFVNGIEDNATRFNLNRVLNLVVAIILFFFVLSMLFANWYAAFVSLGLISLILGFALQTPITSFIAWVYIVISRPYKVGDRIKVGESKGDVIDIGYIETTLWEIKGEELTTEDPTGKIIRFPNSKILDTPVFNYSWAVFPYVWNEIKFHIAYESDLDYMSHVSRKIVTEELGDDFLQEAGRYREILKKLTIDISDISTNPEVIFRVNENTWIELIIRYPVEPLKSSRTKSRLIEKLLREFNKNKQNVMVPEGVIR